MASISGEINGQENARAFVENVLSKYLKIVKVCDNDKASECNFPAEITPLNTETSKFISDNLKSWSNIGYGTQSLNSWTDTYNADFSIYVDTVDGFSAKVYYNPKCARNAMENSYGKETCSAFNIKEKDCHYTYAVDDACMNVIYDMNGKKGPNHVGEDIGFVTVFWSGLNTVAAAPGIPPYSVNSQSNVGRQPRSAASYCFSKGSKKDHYSLPNIHEISSIMLNGRLCSITQYTYWSGSYVQELGYFAFANYIGAKGLRGDSGNFGAYCVRR